MAVRRRNRWDDYLDDNVVRILVILNLLGFILSWLISRSVEGPDSATQFGPNSDGLILSGGNATYLVLQGQVWRWLSACFLHANLLHISLNLLAAVQLSSFLRSVLRGHELLTLWILSGLMGSIFSTTWSLADLLGDVISGLIVWSDLPTLPQTLHLSIGASGAVMGLIGFLFGYTWKATDPMGAAVRRQAMFWLLGNLALGLSIPQIDNAAHLGGALVGFFLGRLRVDLRLGRVSRHIFDVRGSRVLAALILLTFGVAVYDFTQLTGPRFRFYKQIETPTFSTVDLLQKAGRGEFDKRPQEGIDRIMAIRNTVPEVIPEGIDESAGVLLRLLNLVERNLREKRLDENELAKLNELLQRHVTMSNLILGPRYRLERHGD